MTCNPTRKFPCILLTPTTAVYCVLYGMECTLYFVIEHKAQTWVLCRPVESKTSARPTVVRSKPK